MNQLIKIFIIFSFAATNFLTAKVPLPDEAESVQRMANQHETMKSLKKAAPSREEQFLENLTKIIENKKAERIAILEKSNDPKKQKKAEALKKRKYLDHIRIEQKDSRTIYLQLANSVPRMEGRSFPYDKEKLNKALQELCDKYGLTIKDITEVAVYRSSKRRKNCILGSWWTANDLYSAAIFINTTKKDNPNNREWRNVPGHIITEDRQVRLYELRRQARAALQNGK